MRAIPPLLCTLALLAAGPPAAVAQSQIAPPGNAGVDEYLETVPGGGGNERIDRNRRGGDAGLPPRARKRLEALGEDGAAAAALADAASAGGGSGDAKRAPGGDGTGANTPMGPDLERAGEGQSGVAAVLGEAVSADGDGMGAALPALLIVTLLGAVGLVVLRRRAAT